MSDLDGLLARFPRPGIGATAWILLALLGSGVAVGAVTQLDRVATAPGVVAPLGQVRTVQHLEGGIAAELLVNQGDAVTADQPLLRLDLGINSLNPTEIEVRLDALLLERARLLAEMSALDLFIPEDLRARRPEMADAEEAAFRTRRREYESSQALLQDREAQKELEIESITAALKSANARLRPLLQQLEMISKLEAARLATRSAKLDLERQVEALEGEIESYVIALPLAQAALAEERERRMVERNRFRKTAAERLREVEIEIERQRELLGRADQQAERRLIRSPIAGVVKTMAVKAVGNVVRPGEPIAEIVPSEERLVVEGRLAPEDIGHVSVGQIATVKLATYDYLRYGSMTGRVAQLAADATRDEDGRHFFRMIIETDDPTLLVGDNHYPISPGMDATVDIKLGQRSVLSYLVSPVLKLREEAFRDR